MEVVFGARCSIWRRSPNQIHFRFVITVSVSHSSLKEDNYYQGSAMQVEESGLSCIYVALAGPKLAAGHFPQSEEQLKVS